jgi:hypothetical protein
MGKNPNTTINVIMLLAAERADVLVDDGAGGQALSDFISEVYQLYYINLELAALWDALVATHEDYCVYRRTINIEAGKEDYALPEDFYKFRKIFPIVSGERNRPLRKFNLEKLGDADSLAAIYTTEIEDAQYRITGQRLWIHPEPTNAAYLELWYVPQFKGLENLSDLIPVQFPNGWEEYVIEGVAARILEKEESDASAQRLRQQQVLKRIMTLAEDRDVGEPHQMQDSEGYGTTWDRWRYR